MAAAVLFLSVAAAGFSAPATMSVTVKETQIRATPSFLAKALAVLAYGDQVQVLDTKGDWARVSLPSGKEGWVSLKALTEKKIVLKSGADVSTSASSGEVALAGKGFNADVEAQYKQEQNLDYTWVDAMEAVKVTTAQIDSFLTKGGLTEQGGAE
jgi:uncharacterized protein YgiM (DUF1202 family)